MQLIKYQPCPPLRDCIELFWLRDSSSAVSAHSREAILPDGRAHLVINLSEDVVRVFRKVSEGPCETLDGSVFCGAHSSPYAIMPAALLVLGVYFRAGGARALLPLPADELHNLRVPLRGIYGRATEELRYQLVNAPSHQARFTLLERFLVERMQRSIPLHRSVAYALRSFEDRRDVIVNDLLCETGLSRRYFSRVFSEQVGLTPKLFQRVRRFQRIIELCSTATEIEWAQVALNAGYYDQAHFIHDVREFCAVTPSTYRSAAVLQRNHMPLAH